MIDERYNFIIQEPWLLDRYEILPMERELILKKVNTHGDMFPLVSAHGLLIENLLFMENHPDEIFTIKIYGRSCEAKQRLYVMLILILGILKHRNVSIYVDPVYACVTLVFREVSLTEEISWKYMGVLEREIDSDIVIEYIGYEKNSSNKYEYLTVLYDRFRQKHGFIRFTDEHTELDAYLESYLEYLTLEVAKQYDTDIYDDVSEEEP